MSEKIVLGHEDALSYLAAQVNQCIYDYETNLAENLTHGQKNQLISAMMRYPAMVTDFADQGEHMIKAYSCMKTCIDAQVVLGIELVDEGRKQQNEGESNG